MVHLHEKYAPILHFNKSELFYPMRVDDLLTYSSLYTKDQTKPIVKAGSLTPDTLVKHGKSDEVFLRSVESGSLSGKELINQWSEGAVEMVLRWAQDTAAEWTDDLAKKAYSWFSPTTQAATQYFWWNSLIAPAISGALESMSGNDLPRLLLPKETHTNAVEHYTASRKKSPGYTYYYRYLKGSKYLYLQYWFFYGYNDWGSAFSGLNDHEGDWECMMLFFPLDSQGQPQEPPSHVVYATHESRMSKSWDDPDVKRTGNHVEGFIGAGSHATYPQPKKYDISALYNLFDYATGDGKTINHTDWAHRINLEDVPWLEAYQGSWGTRFWLSNTQAKTALQLALAATPFSGLIGLTMQPKEFEVPGVSAPKGPAGSQREQNTNPLIWAGIDT